MSDTSHTYTCGFIGCGNMGSALAAAAAKTIPGEQLILADHSAEKAAALAEKLHAVHGTNEEAAACCDFLFLGVKPQMMAKMLSSIAPVLKSRTDRFVLVSMAAGLTIARIQELAGGDYPVIRIMPNTPVSVGEGMILYAASDAVTAEEKALFTANMAMAGILDELSEGLIDAGSAVSGCGPAFADLFLEALADGGVECGLPREKAQLYAAQMLLGSAKLCLAGGEHPGVLKDRVCSPGGSTIVGVHALEHGSFRGITADAVVAAFEKTKDLGKH